MSRTHQQHPRSRPARRGATRLQDAPGPQQTQGAWIVRAPPNQANSRRQTMEGASSLPTVSLPPSAQGALNAPPASTHSLSGDSLMDAVLPTPGAATRIMQSELMRLTARTAKAAQQPHSSSAPLAGEVAAAGVGDRESASATAASDSAVADRASEGAAVQAAVHALAAAATEQSSPSTDAAAQAATPQPDTQARSSVEGDDGDDSESALPGGSRSKRRRDSDLTQLPELLPSLAVFEDEAGGLSGVANRRASREEARSREDGGSPVHMGPCEGEGLPRRRTSRSLGSSFLQTIDEAVIDEPEDLGC